MPDDLRVLYAETSALVKLAVEEAETEAARRAIESVDVVVTSVLTEVELARAVLRARAPWDDLNR